MSSNESRPRARRSNDRVDGPGAGGDRGRPPRSLNFYTITDVAEMLGLSVRSVRRLIARAELAVHRFGGAVRVAEADLKAFPPAGLGRLDCCH
jgi:excisionase family DNA binding protein